MGKLRSKLVPRWPSNIITVDPGFGGTGWAYWLGNEFPITGVIKERNKTKGMRSEERLALLFQEFRMIIRAYGPREVVLESMQIWSGSLQSQASAFSGDLFLLQTLVGVYCGVCIVESVPFRTLTPTQWKGQLSKEALRSRIRLINGESYPDHAEDAVGIGIHVAGVM